MIKNDVRGVSAAWIVLMANIFSANAMAQNLAPHPKSNGVLESLIEAEKISPPKSVQATVLSKTDREKIQRVITLQLRAFERNDEAVAFSYATADTRKVFGTPRQFMEMVRSGYAPLLKHSSREFLEAANVNGLTIQPVKFLTSDGDIVVALYTMERQADNEWRIGGCELAPKSLQAT